MTEIIIAALGGAFTSPLVIWLIFFKWKKGVLISELRLKKSSNDFEYHDQLSQRIDILGQSLLENTKGLQEALLREQDLRIEVQKVKTREKQMMSDMAVLIRIVNGNDNPEFLEIKERYAQYEEADREG